MKFIVADRDQTFLEILQCYSWHQGFEMEPAGNGLECLFLIRDFRPDIVVLEASLLWGGCDGVLDVMAQEPESAETPVLLVADSPLEFTTMNQRQVVGWLSKPFRMSYLVQQVFMAAQRGLQTGTRSKQAACDHQAQHTSCPLCGRTLRVSPDLLGTTVSCSHCHGTFTAPNAESLQPIRSPRSIEYRQRLQRCLHLL